jgi:DNA-binding NtrC family response regulator
MINALPPGSSVSAETDANAPRTILIVEDEVMLRLWIADELRESGFTVHEAANAGEALQVLTSTVVVHAVLTDVRMPGAMDGVGLSEWLARERPDVKVLITSSQRVASAAHGFIAKPYGADKVIRSLMALLGVGTDRVQAG